MQSCLSEIIQQLQQLLRNTKVAEQKVLGEVLVLQKLINNSKKVVPQIIKKQTIKPNEKQQKKENIKISVQSEVTSFLNEIQMKQKQLANQQKLKPELKFPQIVVEKKPPIPTVSRVQKTTKNVVTSYIPPRNKNEVTGKVTQSTIRTSAQKVFKPEVTNLIRSSSKEMIKTKQTFSKSKNQIEVKQQKKESSVIKQVKSQQPKKIEKMNEIRPKKVENPKVLAKELDKKLQQEQQQKVNSKFSVFVKDTQEFLDQLIGKGGKNRKMQLQKLIRQLQNEEIGYKKSEEQSRFSCIKQINNYSYSRSRVIKTITHSIQRSKWCFIPQLFQLELLISDLENQIQNLKDQRQYKIDAKQQYRIFKHFKVFQQLTFQAEEKAKYVPDQLQLKFHYKTVSNSQPEKEDDFLNTSESIFNQKLSNLVDTIQQMGTLQKSQLRCLQVLSEIGIFKCKKTPILTMSQQYESWKNYYFTNA